jgi:hypothetical protein
LLLAIPAVTTTISLLLLLHGGCLLVPVGLIPALAAGITTLLLLLLLLLGHVVARPSSAIPLISRAAIPLPIGFLPTAAAPTLPISQSSCIGSSSISRCAVLAPSA